ncbi:RagB/SusD family nutrient uptake outer membrane protein [Sphingobacterium sp. LRF_L2]|uniref:RagB/SusD family nutrient uptake outer membrane protein n=1 Tax=Sphingobacterium sp. LRF_L2 TaxID=3369421 RepID=UPI003F5D68D0
MKKIIIYLSFLFFCTIYTGCKNYLDTESPSNTDDAFVTNTPPEAFKILSWCYANYRQNVATSLYNWNDPIGSDCEMYPEANSTNNLNAIMQSEAMTVDAMKNPFDNLYATLARALRLSELIKEKPAYIQDVENSTLSDWTQLYGETIAMKAFCYFNLLKHFGDVPYGYENRYVEDYVLSSRFEVFDILIAELKSVEPLMYRLGEGNITAERMSRTFVNTLIGQLALYSGSYQTIRTDVSGLYGDVQFTRVGNEQYNSVYARRTDYQTYYQIAEEYFEKAVDNSGTARLIDVDTRSYTTNPYQRHFQYMQDLEVSPESIFEIGNIQGGQSGQTTTSEYPYNFGRPSNGGGTNAAPTKTFGALRIVPTFYYGGYEEGDRRRDVSATVTGSTGDGNEAMLTFIPGSKLDGGIALNKWDENRMSPPYTAGQRNSGINFPILRMADVLLMLAEVKAELGDDVGALALLNQIRTRAFGTTAYNLSGISGTILKQTIWNERKLELVGEGTRRWDMIRSGKFSEDAIAVRNAMSIMVSDLRAKGYHSFPNGKTISNYIYTKKVKLDNPLTYESTSENDPALYPGWRGQYDWSQSDVSGKVVGTNHNVAIRGLFTYIDPESTEAMALVADGYSRTNWGIDLVNNESVYDRNLLSGIKSVEDPPRYFFPIPFETINKSNGKITNGYGLPQQ